MNLLSTEVTNMLDPLQLAYKSDISTESALLVLLNSVLKQLELTKGYAKVLFKDFCAAFNAVKLHFVLQRMTDLNINKSLILWIRDFLSCSTQKVCVNSSLFRVHTSTGCSQRCVLSPMLFSLFTNEFVLNENTFKLIKYADDMALVGLLQKNNFSSEIFYLAHVKAFEIWSTNSQLEMNVAKTKEVIFVKSRV